METNETASYYLAYLSNTEQRTNRKLFIEADSHAEAIDRAKEIVLTMIPDAVFEPYWSNETVHPQSPGWFVKQSTHDLDRRLTVYDHL